MSALATLRHWAALICIGALCAIGCLALHFLLGPDVDLVDRD